MVLQEFLNENSYRAIAINVMVKRGQKMTPKTLRSVEKSVDNALGRIRFKAMSLRKEGGIDIIPILDVL